jgi:flagellar M-ring protein FliF
MASATEGQTNPISGFFQSPLGSNLALGAGMALVMGIMAAVFLWGQKPDYRILLSNFSDRDGGAIIAALQQMNVPYQFAEGGGAILVPAERVHDARLKLAAQGLPKAGNVGFELMENQKLGVSQFLEQVNFQRALEGELARSINSIAVVQASRVHLAIPKPTVFVREKQKPTASVLLNLHPGRTLEQQQVSAIVHLVSSSVPELPIQNVTVVDQNGNLLSSQDDPAHNNRLDPNQLKYIQELQVGIVRRIESILTPMVGAENIRAEATADVDFSRSEQAAETFKPNNSPENTVKRSEHSNESSSTEADKAGGVPGAASNQPGQGQQNQQAEAANTGPTSTQKENTVNYEVDKTVRYVQQPMGNIKRLTVAVLVNNKTEIDADGKPTTKPLTDAEKEQITGLVKEAMGYNKERGDSLNVVNTAFTVSPKEVIPEEPFWKQFANLETAKSVGQYLLSGLVILYLFFNVLRPMIRRLSAPPVVVAPTKTNEETEQDQESAKNKSQPNQLDTAKKMAAEDPRMVANIVKTWVSE